MLMMIGAASAQLAEFKGVNSMDKTMDIYRVSDMVKAILKHDERARNSDSFLYFRIIDFIAENDEINLEKVSVVDFLLNSKEMGFPPFESVRRARQKAQEKFPELRACNAVEAARAENEIEYREFARSV